MAGPLLPCNFGVAENGARVVDFSSQYHHNSGVQNLVRQDPSVCWFTSVYAPLPQHVVIDMGQPVCLTRVGIFLHGENSQNPRRVSFACGADPACPEPLAEMDLPHRGGDHLCALPSPRVARFVRYTIFENFGGSGAYTTGLQLYGLPAQ